MKTLLVAILFIGLGLLGLVAAELTMPKAGDRAPLVSGIDQNGKPWKLSDLIGKKIILLYFYPKDDTPGCTKEACGFRDRISELRNEGVQVIGVSFDSAESHRQFISKHNLPFPLVADTDGKIADAYGTRIAGKDMARRVSFVIGLDGKIIHVTDSPSADTHLAETKAAIEKIKKG